MFWLLVDLGYVIINFFITFVLVSLLFLLNLIIILYFLRCLMFSFCFVRWKVGLFIWKVKVVCWWNILRNGIEVVDLVFIIQGFCGLGGTQVSNRGKIYFFFCGELIVSNVFCFFSLEGLKVIFRVIFVFFGVLGVAVIVFFVWKLLLFICNVIMKCYNIYIFRIVKDEIRYFSIKCYKSNCIVI